MAGLFGFFDYNKPGPGVSKDEPPKHRLFLFFEVYFRKFWKLVTLNIIYFIACIPIVTIGPATAGFTYVLRNFSREEHAWTVSDFKEHMFKNFKQGFIVSVINLLIFIIWGVATYFYRQMLMEGSWIGNLFFLMLAAGLIFIIINFYIFEMMVTFRLSIRQIYKNAFIFAMVRLPMNILMLVIFALVAYGFYYYYLIGILLTPFIVISTLGFMVNFYVYPTIEKYMIKKVQTQDPEEPQGIENGEEQKE